MCIATQGIPVFRKKNNVRQSIFKLVHEQSSFHLNPIARSNKTHAQRFLGDDLAGECDPDCDADQPSRRREG